MRNSQLLLAGVVLMAAGAGVLGGCNEMKDNDGSSLTTAAGAPITESMLIGKWDIDGERTNKANGHDGVVEVASDVTKDVFGSGWRFESGGVLKVDATVMPRTGRYSIAGNKLTISDPKHGDQIFEASFRDGYLYLKNGVGKYKVFEKDKLFGL